MLISTGALLLFLLSLLLVACGATQGDTAVTTNVAGTNPTTTVTLHIGAAAQSPTPPLPAYTCGAWATNSTPSTKTTMVGVYALFKQIVNGNPNGVDGATAVATVYWPDGSVLTLSTITTADGLAKFGVPLTNKSAINGVTLITVNFTKDGVPPCNVKRDRAAFFTVVPPAVTPTPTPKKGH